MHNEMRRIYYRFSKRAITTARIPKDRESSFWFAGGGGTPNRSSWWVPWPGPEGGGGIQPGIGYPLARSGHGVPWPRMGYPPAMEGSTPGIGQQMEYLIRCGRYASCVHAGGLSCLCRIRGTSYSLGRNLRVSTWLCVSPGRSGSISPCKAASTTRDSTARSPSVSPRKLQIQI